MAQIDVFVWYDKAGNIVAVGQPTASGERVEPLTGPENEVVRFACAEDELPRLHLTHRIDPATGRICSHEGRGGAAVE